MQIIFLDMDGVLNNKQHFLATKEVKMPGADTLSDADLFAMKRDIAPNNIWVLGFILDQLPDLKIVISSSWRNFYQFESFKELFKIFKLDDSRITGKTPRVLSNDRRHEINLYIESFVEINQKVPDWVAVDDHVIFNIEDPEKHREYLTDGWLGLTMHDAFKIIKHFKPEWKEPEMGI